MPPLTYSSEELAKRIEANTKKITALQSQFEKLERLMIRITMGLQKADKGVDE